MSAPAVTSIADRTTWAKRNPTAKVLPVNVPKRKLTDIEKKSRKVSAEQKKESHATIREYLLERAERYAELAEAHTVKVSKIEELINSSTHYKKPRAPTLQNAILHYMCEKVNGGMFICIILYPRDAPI